jgi:FRG domain
VPTRLLDFTLNPLAAAYFAAADPRKQAASMAVWAVDAHFVAGAWAAFRSGVRFVRVSRGANPFLHAQSGLFLYDSEDTRLPLQRRILDLDLQRQKHLTEANRETLARSERVRCLTLPSNERTSLLRRLADRRVTRAHLRPTLDNAVAELWRH